MMRGTKLAALVLLLIGALLCTSCIMDEKVIEIVLKNSTCMPFEESGTSVTFGTEAVIDMAEEIEDSLERNDLSRSDIKTAKLISCTYQVTDLTPPDGHDDWEIGGVIKVERIGKARAAETIVQYTSQSVLGAMPAPVAAQLVPAGVDVLNEALEDFINGEDPILVFETDNDAVVPPPSGADPIVFDWEACLNIYVQLEQTLEMVDPIPGE